MTRSNAREIAVQLIFSLGFGNLSAQEVLDSQLTTERFAELAEENALYAQFPNEKQQQYIRDLVQGVFSHGPELDDYISRYAVGWSFARIPRMAAAIMRTWAVLAYLPKATVQAAIGGVPLAMGLACGQVVLTVAVVAILVTAPLGALAIDLSFRRLLRRDRG